MAVDSEHYGAVCDDNRKLQNDVSILRGAVADLMTNSDHSDQCKTINGHPAPYENCCCHIGKARAALSET